MFSDVLIWALGQIGEVIAYCWLWFDRLMSEIGGDKLLIGVFACGVLGCTFLMPLLGFSGSGLGADSVRSSKKEDGDDEIIL